MDTYLYNKTISFKWTCFSVVNYYKEKGEKIEEKGNKYAALQVQANSRMASFQFAFGNQINWIDISRQS